MNIPKDGGWGKEAALQDSFSESLGRLWRTLPRDWLSLSSIGLLAASCFGLGLLAARENGPPKDPLWIEQLPPEELPGSISTSTRSGAEEPVSSFPASPAPAQQATAPAAPVPGAQTGTYVASKTGLKYYLPNCAGAKRIKEENKVWFATKELAVAAGYQPAANCKGL